MGLAQIGPPARTIEAGRFVLLDGAGRERAVLEMAEGGGPHLILADPDGQLQVGLFASPGGVRGLALFDGENTRVAVTAAPGGAATVGMKADGRVAGGSITLIPGGSARMGAWGPGGSVTITTPGDPDRAARVEVQDGDGVLRGQLPTEDLPFGGGGRVRPVQMIRGPTPEHAPDKAGRELLSSARAAQRRIIACGLLRIGDRVATMSRGRSMPIGDRASGEGAITMLVDDLRLNDDPAAITVGVRALAVEAHAVLTRAATGAPGRRPGVPIDLMHRIEGFRQALDEGPPEEGRLRDVRLWLDGLRRHAVVLRDLGELH